ncbi:MAG: ABC transporter ATP-binding protein [Myxococcota bacterium]|nr:ABC transporter ATP-binding protein [Myxococcota bacterium]
MSEPAAIEARQLSKRFRSLVAVERVDLDVAAGDIFGFIGPNGAGKTTTLRMLLGLITPTEGRVRIFGHDIEREFKRAIQPVGALIEGAAFYPFLSARNNLALFGNISGHRSHARVEQVLEWVGLAARGDDRVAGYSQGMRQRLGLALALLERPRLLILDEPTNGLDPQGSREIRELIRRIRDEEGTTILLSSHLLAEMEGVCDRLAIIANGRILRVGALDEVIGSDSERLVLATSAGDDERAAALLRERFSIHAARPGSNRLEFDRGDREPAEINRALVEAGIGVAALAPQLRTLEQAFIELTGTSSAVQ